MKEDKIHVLSLFISSIVLFLITIIFHEIGADVQKDGTVTVKGSDGRMKVLPKTGETENIALSVLGSLMVLGSAFIFKKRI